MQKKRLYAALVISGVGVVVASAIALLSVQGVSAQCGSQASSCKNCHETQAKDPVNSDGTGWHQSHAFGDFCYICHGGNSQSLDESAAHTGMVDPMADVQTACAQCHPNDLQARVDVYAAKLGKPAGSLSSAPAAPIGTAAVTNPTPSNAASAAATPTSQAPSPAHSMPLPANATVVDYVQRYDQRVLHQEPTNWGNVILGILIAAMVVGGGGMIILRERLVRVTFKETKPVSGEYPPDVVDMIPALAKLRPDARKSLQEMLRKPAAVASLLDAVGKLTQKDEED